LTTGSIDECRKLFTDIRNRNTSNINKCDIDKQIANIFIQNNCQSDAESIYRDILEYDSNVDDYNTLGILFRQQGKYKEAEDCYFKALKEYPDNPAIYYNVAILYFAKDDRFAARKYVTKALELDPTHENALKLLKKIEKGSL
jgi:tetratricopeptide (TPR) repeat protein